MADAGFRVQLHGLAVGGGIFFPVRDKFVVRVVLSRERCPRRLNLLMSFPPNTIFFEHEHFTEICRLGQSTPSKILVFVDVVQGVQVLIVQIFVGSVEKVNHDSPILDNRRFGHKNPNGRRFPAANKDLFRLSLPFEQLFPCLCR